MLKESYFIYDCSSLVKPSFITELNEFSPIYCSESNFSEKKKEKSKIISATNQKRFFIEKSTEKSKLSVQTAKVSGKKIETTGQKVHNFQLTRILKKRKQKMVKKFYQKMMQK